MSKSGELSRAIELRKSKKPEEAMRVLTELLALYPNDPDVSYQLAWTCDFMRKESEAVPHYERAIANGLVEDRVGAMLGLGSTYRCLGEYEKSLRMFDQGLKEFPEARALKVFRALTLYNLKRADEAVGELLIQLMDTSKDESILAYQGALRFYADKLDETWK